MRNANERLFLFYRIEVARYVDFKFGGRFVRKGSFSSKKKLL